MLQQGRGGKRLGLGPLTDAGMGLMPAFDKLATSLIGDNPALTEALRYNGKVLSAKRGTEPSIIKDVDNEV